MYCKNCGNKLSSHQPRIRFCSDKCRMHWHYLERKKILDNARKPENSILKKCSFCRGKFYTKNKEEIFCCLACARLYKEYSIPACKDPTMRKIDND